VPGTTLLHGGTVGTGPGQHLPPAQARSPLAGLLPAGLDLVHLLGTRILTLRRVHTAASSTCAWEITCLLQTLQREKTWETLARLLLFHRIALAARARGSKATRSSSTRHCRLNCLAAFMFPFGELIARIHRQAATDGPRMRAKGRAAAPETAATSPQASDMTAAAIRALLAEGAPGRAIQLLTSDGVCVAADPAVLTRLRDLHPQGEGLNLEPSLPDDRPDVAPSWASDQLLAMEAVVQYFQPGSAAGPSGLRPQHLLDCLNSADSAVRAAFLEALLTLVTATSSGRIYPRAAPYLCAAHLIPLRKKDGVVRPIAVGDTLRTLVAKWLLASAQGRNSAAALATLLTGFVKGSPCEVVAMGVQAQVDALHGSTGWLLVQVALKNAINSIARTAILEALE